MKVVERTDELRRAQLEKMRQLNRLAELGQLSSGLFHDLLNLLTALSLRTDEEKDPSLVSAFSTTKQIEGFMEAVRKQIRGADGAGIILSHAKESITFIQLVNYQANKAHVRITFHHDPDEEITHYDAPFKFQEIPHQLTAECPHRIVWSHFLSRFDTRARTIEIEYPWKSRGIANASRRRQRMWHDTGGPQADIRTILHHKRKR